MEVNGDPLKKRDVCRAELRFAICDWADSRRTGRPGGLEPSRSTRTETRVLPSGFKAASFSGTQGPVAPTKKGFQGSHEKGFQLGRNTAPDRRSKPAKLPCSVFDQVNGSIMAIEYALDQACPVDLWGPRFATSATRKKDEKRQ